MGVADRQALRDLLQVMGAFLALTYMPRLSRMLTTMSELLKSLSDCVSALKTEMLVAISIPLAQPDQFGERENAATDRMVSRDPQEPVGTLFDCVTEHPGRMTRNGRGSLEIGAAHAD